MNGIRVLLCFNEIHNTLDSTAVLRLTSEPVTDAQREAIAIRGD